MIEILTGEVLRKGVDHVVVDCRGVGYLATISQYTAYALPSTGACRLLVHYAVLVDVRSGQSEHRLYGFASEEERGLFRRLVEVQGVSATVAMAILSARKAEDVRMAILTGDETLLRSIKGIGPKLAQRIIGELSGRLLKDAPMPALAEAAVGGNTLRHEALAALVSLGLDRGKAERAVHGILSTQKNGPPELEELIRMALKNM
jgi:holliday junction DNA helicase RuvA